MERVNRIPCFIEDLHDSRNTTLDFFRVDPVSSKLFQAILDRDDLFLDMTDVLSRSVNPAGDPVRVKFNFTGVIHRGLELQDPLSGIIKGFYDNLGSLFHAVSLENRLSGSVQCGFVLTNLFSSVIKVGCNSPCPIVNFIRLHPLGAKRSEDIIRTVDGFRQRFKSTLNHPASGVNDLVFTISQVDFVKLRATIQHAADHLLSGFQLADFQIRIVYSVSGMLYGFFYCRIGRIYGVNKRLQLSLLRINQTGDSVDKVRGKLDSPLQWSRKIVVQSDTQTLKG